MTRNCAFDSYTYSRIKEELNDIWKILKIDSCNCIRIFFFFFYYIAALKFYIYILMFRTEWIL